MVFESLAMFDSGRSVASLELVGKLTARAVHNKI